MDKAGSFATFGGGLCKIFDARKRLRGVVPLQKGLYQVWRESSEESSAMYARVGADSLTFMELHRVLGQVSPAMAKKQWARGGFLGVKIDKSSDIFDCESCTAGKIHEESIPKKRENPMSKTFGEVWYADIWGPAPVASIGGNQYCEIYTCDATRWRIPFFYKTKSQAEDTVLEFDAMLENQLGIRMKRLITDQAGEYKDFVSQKALRKRGIVHVYTTHDTHQEVGVAERFNRTVFERVRACLHAVL